MKFATLMSVVAVGTLMLLAVAPKQAHGLPHPMLDGLADKSELEKAIVEAILSVQSHSGRRENGQVQSKYQEVMLQSAHQRRGGQSAEIEANQRRPEAGELKATAQRRGLTIEGCGFVGTIIESALKFGLAFIPGGEDYYGVYVACPTASYPCTTVTVEVPADDVKADVDVCEESNGDTCVEVYAGSCSPGFFAIPIVIPVPLPSGKQVSITIKVDALSQCASVEVNAPQCSK